MFGSGFLQDVHIWKNKVPVQNPLLCEEDGPVYQLRRWYEQFYVDQADIAPEMVDRFEFEVDTTKANEYWQEEVAENLAQEGARTTPPRPSRGHGGRLMASFVPTSADTLEDQRLYTSARLVEVACLDCLARVGVKKNSEHHTSIQWTAEARAPVPGARPAHRRAATSRTAARGCCRASRPPPATGRSRSAPRTVTEHMSDESFELKVVDVVEETADAHSISFEVPAGAEEQFAYKPGQFLTLAVPSDQTGVAARCYSLSSSPVGGGPLTITVKRTAEGYASNWVCDNLREGDTMRVLPPSGIFTPASLSADLLLFAGGSGITPVISITRTALAQGTGRIVLFYANRDEKSVIFAARAHRAGRRAPRPAAWSCTGSSRCRGCPARTRCGRSPPAYPSYDAFVCGPAPFMKMTVAALKELEFPRERRHQEKFISLGGNPFGDLHDQEVAEHEIEDAETDPDDVTAAAAGRARPAGAGASSRSSSTARTTPSTTGRPAPSCSTTSRRRASRRRTPAARGSARPAPSGCSRAR